jgi:hypothetical protein
MAGLRCLIQNTLVAVALVWTAFWRGWVGVCLECCCAALCRRPRKRPPAVDGGESGKSGACNGTVPSCLLHTNACIKPDGPGQRVVANKVAFQQSRKPLCSAADLGSRRQ